MTSPVKPQVTEYFTGLASLYSDHRPTYPTATIQWLLHDLTPPIRAADIGCGTGISARLFAAEQVQVIGVDPNNDMLEEARRLAHNGPAIDYRLGQAESTGLQNGSVNLVLCA